MVTARYLGPIMGLRGKVALLRQDPQDYDTVLVQFTDMETGFGHGWHPFDSRDFVIESDF
jgi:hypothetical protein